MKLRRNPQNHQGVARKPKGLEQGDFEEVVRVATERAARYLSASQASAVAMHEKDSPDLTPEKIAGLIDHTLLKPEASREEIRKLCKEAVRFGFASVCVNPCNVPEAAELVHGSNVKVCTVIGFPLGANLPQSKMYEAKEAIKQGAQEVDMVINIGALKSGLDKEVESDICGVAEAAHRGGAICKVILETVLLTRDEKIRAARASVKAGADFVKTSTGFSAGGATVEDVALLRSVVGPKIGVKASGGIRTLDDLRKMVSAGATRIGASAGVKIMEQAMVAPAPIAPSPASKSTKSY